MVGDEHPDEDRFVDSERGHKVQEGSKERRVDHLGEVHSQQADHLEDGE